MVMAAESVGSKEGGSKVGENGGRGKVFISRLWGSFLLTLGQGNGMILDGFRFRRVLL